MKERKFQTAAVREGHRRTMEGEHSLPIFTTSSFVFENAQQAADRFAETEPGNVYSRFSNPTVKAFEDRLAALEGAKYCVATASGMSAITTLCLSLLKSGDHVIASRGLFGATITLFNKHLSRFNIEVEFLPPSNYELWARKINSNTKMLFVETPSNPLCEVIDIQQLSRLAKQVNDCKLVVDNCACTPALQRPLEFGADIVVHSATKFLDGQGRAVGGAIVTNDEQVAKDTFGFLRTAGPSMSPFNAWIFYQGLETLDIRMQRSCESAQQIANWLSEHPSVSKLHYPGLESNSGHELAKRQQKAFGALLAFEVEGGREQAWKVIDSTSMISITANLGDVKTIVTHPASTTHARISEEQRKTVGVTESLIRMSVGLEAVEDIVADIDTGLSKIQ